MSLPEKLVCLRKEKRLTQLELAEMLKVSRQAVSRWETGDAVPSIDNLRFLSDLYEVPINYLLDDKIDPLPQEERSVCEERPEAETSGRKRDRPAIRAKQVFIIVCILGLAIMALVCIATTFGESNDYATPIGEMQEEFENGDSDGSFSIQW